MSGLEAALPLPDPELVAEVGLVPDPTPVAPAPGGGEGGARMLMHVTWTAVDAIHRMEDVTHLQRTAIAVMERVAASPRTRAHGFFADRRGGFALVEVSRAGELMELFTGLLDVARLDVHPVTPTDEAVRHLRGLVVTEEVVG